MNDIADRVMCKGKGALVAKFDLKEAYRQVLIHPDDRCMLGIEWNGQLFVDTALPFGLQSAPIIFSALVEALASMIRQKGVKGLDHYLDDFSIVGAPKTPECSQSLRIALEMCEQTGFFMKPEKTVGPTTRMIILVVELDSERLQLRLPQDKLDKLRELVAT